MHTEVAILGGGPGGYAAAFRAADLGADVTIIEERPVLGGVCLIEGCIPSKALLHVARGLAETDELAEWGVRFADPRIDCETLRRRKDKTVSTLTSGLGGLASKRGVRVIRGRGALESARRLRLDGETDDPHLGFERLIVATGSRPLVPPPMQLDSERLMTSRDALELHDVPESLLIVGGGYIGLEMGTVYARLGSAVTVVEMLDRLLTSVDQDLVKPLRHRLDQVFASIELNTRVASLSEHQGGIEAVLESNGDQRKASFDKVLIAVGRRPNSNDIGLENTDVELDDGGFIQVDAHQRTAAPHIFAVGDVAGEPLLAHKAFHEGYVAAAVATGDDVVFDKRAIPAVVFTDPEVAWAGLTEEEARRRCVSVSVARYPWAASGRAQGLGRAEGLTKLLFHPASDRVVGAGMVGVGAGDLISEAVLGIEMGCSAEDIASSIHPHPTLSETVGGASDVHLGLATEVYRPKRGSRRADSK